MLFVLPGFCAVWLEGTEKSIKNVGREDAAVHMTRGHREQPESMEYDLCAAPKWGLLQSTASRPGESPN